MAFLRNLLATLTGLFIFSLFGFFVFVGIASVASSDEKPTVQDNSVLYLNLSGQVSERVVEDPFYEIFPNSSPRPISLLDMVKSIKNAKDDDRIQGIYMEHQFLIAGYASLQEIRDALLLFKESGKFIYSYSDFMSEKDFYLASVADEIYLNEGGMMEFNGLSANITFWKGLFDKLQIEPEIFRVGEYKSYIEPYTRKDMSDENREQIAELLNSIYDVFIQNVAKSRDIDPVRLREISDKLLIQLPTDAKKYGLVTEIGYEDQVKQLIMDKVGAETSSDIKFISERRYSKAIGSGKYSRNKIAVIVANGDIVIGGEDENIVGEKFAREIRRARENKSVKAIVIRVNSPGGSFTAADIIWREIQKTKGEKPMIASMSNVAASGGYYISMLCDTILVQPNTITGSIGAFSMLFNFEDFLEEKLGITHDVENTGEYSDFITVTRPLTDYEKSVMQKGVDNVYDIFVTKAADGRGMDYESLNKVAGGRVWTGNDAIELGLADLIGGLDDAIELAAIAAGIEDDFQPRYYPIQKPFMEELLSKLSGEAEARIFGIDEPEIAKYARELKALNRMKGVQARLPMDIEIN